MRMSRDAELVAAAIFSAEHVELEPINAWLTWTLIPTSKSMSNGSARLSATSRRFRSTFSNCLLMSLP